MAKKLSTYRLPEEVRQMLKKLAADDKRSESQMLEILIEQAAKEAGIVVEEKKD